MAPAQRTIRASTACEDDKLAGEAKRLNKRGKPKSALRRKAEATFNALKSIIQYLDDHDWSLYSAGLGFYALVSVTPLVLIAVALAGVFFGDDLAKAQLGLAITAEAGPQVAALVVGLAEGAGDVLSLSLASLFGFVVLMWSSTNLFTQVRNALNVAWSLRPVATAKTSLWHTITEFLRQRSLAALGTLVVGALFIALIAVRVVLSSVEKTASSFLDLPFWVWDIIDLWVAITFVTLLVRAIYRVIPEMRPGGMAPWIGACVTACLIVAGRTGVAVYISVGSATSAYGAAGTLVVFLGWAYWSAFAFMFGARLTHLLACRWGCWPEAVTEVQARPKPPGAPPPPREKPSDPGPPDAGSGRPT